MADLIDSDGEVQGDDRVKAEILNEYFIVSLHRKTESIIIRGQPIHN